MKKGTPDHPKTVDLSDRLKINRAWACGILELLWSFTRDYAPEGDVGRFSDSAIARAVHWPKSPSILIGALIENRWVDTCSVHRLVVHNWADHCDDYTKKKLLRSKSTFTPCATKSGQCPDNVQTILDSESRQFSPHACAEPCLASALPVAISRAAQSTETPDAYRDLFDGKEPIEWLESVFTGEWMADTWRAFPKYVNTPEQAKALRDNTPLWMATRKWRDGFGTNSVKYLQGGVWLKPPHKALMAEDHRNGSAAPEHHYRSDFVPIGMGPCPPDKMPPDKPTTMEDLRAAVRAGKVTG